MPSLPLYFRLTCRPCVPSQLPIKGKVCHGAIACGRALCHTVCRALYYGGVVSRINVIGGLTDMR